MQFPESWLREFCNPPISTAELAETLTMAGLEVEDLRPVAPPFSRVVVGHLLEVQPHPNADRLRVCTVDVGQGQSLNIVCGAPNARAGIRVPCALVGAELPPGEDGKPLLIRMGKLRGVDSQGMLCSARELQLSQDHGGLLELPDTAPIGQDLRLCLGLDDTLFTLKLTPNLAHCLSIYGVAREVAALTGAPLTPEPACQVAPSVEDTLPVRISAPDLCGRFSGRIVRHINTRASTPAWMVDRLARCGQRSVNALVDISNYVMFELGRPSHIFDLDRIQGGLDVRWGRPGETLRLLNGNTVTLDADVGVIADDHQVESLAGIMGGDATAVSDDTCHIFVEAAFWWPRAVAGRSRRYNFSTDAGHRFERGVDPSRTVAHIERITQLILDICGTAQTRVGPVADQQVGLSRPAAVRLRVARAARVIGMPLDATQCRDALHRLGLEVSGDEDVLSVVPPPHRFDLAIEEDLIEEVARMIGYRYLPHTPPQAPVLAKSRPESRRSAFAVRRQLAALGYQETINFSFVESRWEQELAGNPDPVRLLNPISSALSVMRSSLMGSLLQVLKFNLDRKAPRVRVFEIGRAFLRDGSVRDSDTTVAGFHQPLRVAGLISGSVDRLQWSRQAPVADFFDAKGDVEALLAPAAVVFDRAEHPALHPGRCARVSVNGVPVGFVGELHPRWRQSYELSQSPILFELDLAVVQQHRVPVFGGVPRVQAVERDIAVWVPEALAHDALLDAIRSAPTGGLLRDAVLFDIYRPKPGGPAEVAPPAAEKSMAVRLRLQSDEATLTDAQIDQAVQAVLLTLSERVGARQRA